MSHIETLTALSQRPRNESRAYLPFPLQLERCVCPSCSAQEADSLMAFDQFGFPVGTVECRQCGFVYTNPRPSETWMKEFYKTFFWFFFQGRRKINERFLQRQKTREWAELRFARCAPFIEGRKSILDIGAGCGLFLDRVRSEFPNLQTAGIEPDPTMAEFCRERLGLEVHQGFFQDYPFNRRFEVITLFHVIEHLFDLTALFEFIHKHLASGGLLIVEAPNVDGGWRTVYMIQLSHLHLFSPRTMKNLFARNGFEVVCSENLENNLDESNLFVVGRPSPHNCGRDLQESARVRAKFQDMPRMRMPLVLRAWIRLAYFALRR